MIEWKMEMIRKQQLMSNYTFSRQDCIVVALSEQSQNDRQCESVLPFRSYMLSQMW